MWKRGLVNKTRAVTSHRQPHLSEIRADPTSELGASSTRGRALQADGGRVSMQEQFWASSLLVGR